MAKLSIHRSDEECQGVVTDDDIVECSNENLVDGDSVNSSLEKPIE